MTLRAMFAGLHEVPVVREVEQALRGEEIECDACGSGIPGGEVVVLDGMLYGVSCGCGWRRAAEILEPLLCHSWTPADIATSLREYEEALRVVSFLRLRIHDRLTRRA